MEAIYREQFQITTAAVDRYGRLKPSWILYFAQQVAGVHCSRLNVSLIAKDQRELFWAVIRHRVQVTRLPRENETITVETWPMPTTRVAFPRSTVAYDQEGKEVFRSISLWVLMDRETRSMVVPGKSGVNVPGLIRGYELTVPGNLLPKVLEHHCVRPVGFSELDVNWHMNNTHYLDWIEDLLPSAFHAEHPVKEFTVCYLSEALEGQRLDLSWELQDGPELRVDAHREHVVEAGQKERVFAAQILYE